MTKKRNKFDRSICEECFFYWNGVYGNAPYCHVNGKKIFDGECIEFKPKEKGLTLYEEIVKDYDAYQSEWN